MAHLRRANDRGGGSFGWLRTRHSFSFGSYFDPEHMGFRSLRVLNEDWIAPSSGFPKHPHRDMEILTYVLEGTLEHHDSLGNGSKIRPGEIQRMSAGTGIVHSEFNPSTSEETHLLQIWIEPDRVGAEPGYEQRSISVAEEPGRFHLLAGSEPEAAVQIRRDARLYAARLRPGDDLIFDAEPGRGLWLQTVRGRARVDGWELAEGDGLSAENTERLAVHADEGGAEVLLFDLA